MLSVQVLMIFLCYGGCAIPLGYCIQLFTRKPENVYLVVILINVIAGKINFNDRRLTICHRNFIAVW